jgi:poly(3-hydroxybutyrate) depolymerase
MARWLRAVGTEGTMILRMMIVGLVFIDEKYVLDDRRIYIAGMSGGAQIASIVAALRFR